MSVAVRADPRAAAVARRRWHAVAADYVALTKPRIILLLELCALCSMLMAARGWPGLGPVVATLAGGALAAGGANALNCWFDRDIDSAMRRTCSRPIPGGRIGERQALGFGISLGVLSFLTLAVFTNLVAASLAVGALLFYVVVYTMYLKRSTSHNIVIGGAAGAVPPLVGWAAVTGGLGLVPLFLFAIVFYWTPPHFWALALLMRRDYAAAGVPMLPVVEGDRRTKTRIVVYSLVLVMVTMLPLLTGSLGAIYLAGAVFLGAVLVHDAVRTLDDPTPVAARRLFHFSLLYLALLFAAAALDRVVVGW